MNRVRTAIVVLLSPLLAAQAAAPAPPSISALSPASGRIGTRVALTGRQFTGENTVMFGPAAIRHVGIASAIGITCTADPNCRPGIVQTLEIKVPARARPGPVEVSVRNANGTSNAVGFTVVK